MINTPPTTGVVTSPNYPDGGYPDKLEKTDIIAVETGSILNLEFTYLAVQACDVSTCPCDYVTIMDGDGTLLMDKTCGYSLYDINHRDYKKLPSMITSNTNMVKIFFHTDDDGSRKGWSISWTAEKASLSGVSTAHTIHIFQHYLQM